MVRSQLSLGVSLKLLSQAARGSERDEAVFGAFTILQKSACNNFQTSDQRSSYRTVWKSLGFGDKNWPKSSVFLDSTDYFRYIPLTFQKITWFSCSD